MAATSSELFTPTNISGSDVPILTIVNPIISSENPDSDDFDASLIYGPVMGRLFYAGLRYKFNRN